jgi:hypothetical protein
MGKMTLEERLLKRLALWREAAKIHRAAMDELDEDVDRDEWLLHKVEAENFERCVSELAIDISARNVPRPVAKDRPRAGAGDQSTGTDG